MNVCGGFWSSMNDSESWMRLEGIIFKDRIQKVQFECFSFFNLKKLKNGVEAVLEGLSGMIANFFFMWPNNCCIVDNHSRGLEHHNNTTL